MRTCSKCGETKELSFYDRNRTKCRKCRNKEHKQRYKEVSEDRVCNICKILKVGSDFEGTRRTCKSCRSKIHKKRNRTKEGHIKKIYHNQKRASIKRGHNMPTYSLDELYDWLMSQKKFHILFDNWKRLDYQKWYAPSVDRKNDDIGYTMSNIQLLTWKENSVKANLDSMTSKLSTGRKKIPVSQYDLNGNFIQSFISTREAERHIGKKCSKEIIKCCNGISHQSQGYIWRYVNTDGGPA